MIVDKYVTVLHTRFERSRIQRQGFEVFSRKVDFMGWLSFAFLTSGAYDETCRIRTHNPYVMGPHA